MKMYRQGDVMIREVSSLPANAKAVKNRGRIVLAHGEVTGHAHAIAVREAKEFTMQDAAGVVTRRLLHIASEATVIIEQGYAMGRPSHIEVRLHGDEVSIFGAGITVAEGVLRL